MLGSRLQLLAVVTGVCLVSVVRASAHSEGDVRLVNGSSPLSGRVEIYHDNKWGTVCNYLFGYDEAVAVCGTLGSPDGQVAEFGPGSGPIWISNLRCPEHSQNMANCTHDGWTPDDCSHDEDVGVICRDVRLINGSSPLEGRVEIFHEDQWGTVCSDKYGDEEAAALCRTMGYIGGEASELGVYGGNSQTIWLDDFDCPANASTIYDCDHQGWENNTCQHDLDVGAICMDIRLVDGDTTMSGRVEIHVGGKAGGICASKFGDDEADVICRTLGAISGKSKYYDEGELAVWIAEMDCAGAEDISGCQYEIKEDTDCQHSAGVECFAMRLVGEDAPLAGRLEVYHHGSWGSVCEDGIDWYGAHQICLMMGMQGGVVESGGAGTGPIWLDDVTCPSDVPDSIEKCEHNGWGVNDCSHDEDVGIRCSQIRLFGGETEKSGWLQVYHNGVWGNICDAGFNETDVAAICEILHWFDGGSTSSEYGPGEGTIWFSHLDCSDEPIHFDGCEHGAWIDHECNHDQDLAITCN